MVQITHIRPLITWDDREAVAVAYQHPDQYAIYLRTLAEQLEDLTNLHVVLTSSGTAALHVALLAAGIDPGDRVAVPAITFDSTFLAVGYCQAEPIVCDVDLFTWMLTDIDLSQFVTAIPVHLYGHSYTYPFGHDEHTLVDDAAEALGNVDVFSVSDMAILSFNWNKLVTGGGGGAVLIKSPDLKTECENYLETFPHYELDHVRAALISSQLSRLDSIIDRKRHLMGRYLDGLDGQTFYQANAPEAPRWQVFLRVPDANAVIGAGQAEDIEFRPVWPCLHCKYHTDDPIPENAHSIQNHWISLPSSLDLLEDDQDRIIEFLKRQLDTH